MKFNYNYQLELVGNSTEALEGKTKFSTTREFNTWQEAREALISDEVPAVVKLSDTSDEFPGVQWGIYSITEAKCDA